MRQPYRGSWALVLWLLVGCGQPGRAEGPTAGAAGAPGTADSSRLEPLRERLLTSRRFDLVPERTAVEVSTWDGTLTRRLLVPMREGHVALRVAQSGAVRLSELPVSLADMTCCDAISPPAGVQLVETSGSISIAAGAVAWSGAEDGEAATFAGTATIAMTGAPADADGPLDAPPMTASGVRVKATVSMTADRQLELRLEGAVAGRLYDWRGTFQVSDLAFALRFAEHAP